MHAKAMHKPLCDVIMSNGKKCTNYKLSPSSASCTQHWKMIPLRIQDEVYAGMNEDYKGRRHLAALKKCLEIWRERG